MGRLIFRRPTKGLMWFRSLWGARSCSILIRRFERLGMTARNDCLNVAAREVGSNQVGVIALVRQKRLWRLLRQGDQRVICLAIGRLADRQVEGERSPSGISQTIKITGGPSPRAAKSASMSPPFPVAAETCARHAELLLQEGVPICESFV